MRKRTVMMKVKIQLPEGCEEVDVENYVEEALGIWCKSYNPGSSDDEMDPRFNIDRHIKSIERISR